MKKRKFLKIYIEITNVCNLNCSFCDKTNREKAFISVVDFKTILEKINNYTDLIALHVKGEPLLHPDLKEILNLIDEYGLKANITTNATILKKKMDIILNSKSIRQINISLHSAEQNNLSKEQYLKDIFECVDNIKAKTNIIISYRLWNLKDIKKNKINENILEELGNKYEFNDIIEKAKVQDFLELEKNIFLNQDIEFKWPNLQADIISKNGKCYGLRNQLAILVNGDVVPCCLDGNGDIVLGNIFNNNLDEILNTSRACNIKEGFEKHELREDLCMRCGFANTKFKKLFNK